jgi:hypothetical protein
LRRPRRTGKVPHIMNANPFLVDVARGAMVESRHRGRYVVADIDGRIVAAGGDIAAPVFPRSAIKFLQALPLVESGAADAFALGAAELAIACASHGGESRHVETVAAWLARIGLGPGDLECGAHMPSAAAAAEVLIRAGTKPSALHNNCSGKHAGMLATCLHLGEPTRGYIAPEHPQQRRVVAAFEAMLDLDLARLERANAPTLRLAEEGREHEITHRDHQRLRRRAEGLRDHKGLSLAVAAEGHLRPLLLHHLAQRKSALRKILARRYVGPSLLAEHTLHARILPAEGRTDRRYGGTVLRRRRLPLGRP